MHTPSLLRESVDPAQIPRGIDRTPVGLRPPERPPLVVALDADSDLAAEERRLSEADVVVVRAAGEAGLRRACAAVCRRARRGQTIVLAAPGWPGATRELLIGPLTELGFEVGADICVACSPEPAPGRRRVLGAGGEACAARALRAVASFAPEAELLGSPEAAELAEVLDELDARRRGSA